MSDTLGRATRTARRRDDAGAAAVVGVVLMLALVITVYAEHARSELPRLGKASEEAWSRDVEAALGDLAAGAARRGEGASATIPAAPRAEGVRVPLAGRLDPAPPGGMLAWRPDCARWNATHVDALGAVVLDARGAARACLDVALETSYGAPVRYRFELGGVLRIQPEGAVVVHGPALALGGAGGSVHHATLSVPELTIDRASGASLGGTPARVDLLRADARDETALVPNAREASWRFESEHGAAWASWFHARLSAAGFAEGAAYTVACVPADCAAGAAGRGAVDVRLFGAGTGAAADLALALPVVTYRAATG
jgi:hypothetical protein